MGVERSLDSLDIGIAQVGELDRVGTHWHWVALVKFASHDGSKSHAGGWNTLDEDIVAGWSGEGDRSAGELVLAVLWSGSETVVAAADTALETVEASLGLVVGDNAVDGTGDSGGGADNTGNLTNTDGGKWWSWAVLNSGKESDSGDGDGAEGRHFDRLIGCLGEFGW